MRLCHSTEIEQLISLHQSPAFYKYYKALCSLSPFLSFLFLAAFSAPTPPPSLFVQFYSYILCASHIFPFPSAPLRLERGCSVKWEQNMCCISCLSLYGLFFPPSNRPAGLFSKLTVILSYHIEKSPPSLPYFTTPQISTTQVQRDG